MSATINFSIDDSLPPASRPAAPDSSPWDEQETRQLTRPLPEPDTPVIPQNTRPESLPTIGHIGRYALKYRIGDGGLGTVYAAHDPLLSRLIAVKTLNVDLPADQRDAFNAMFLNEAKASGSLSHPHIVTVFDAGVHNEGEHQGAYIAMELLKGKDLRQLMKEGWRPTPAQAGLIVRRVADALAFAHSKGVVHCDIKPANIFMVGRTQPRVLDFGIARIAKRRDAGSRGDTTQHDAADDLLAGSPYYMAPEQVRNENVDRRADVYSLGVVLYELLTGHRPFDGESLSAITDAVLTRKAPSAQQVDPSVPQELSDIAERAMMRNRDHRTHSARAMSRELRAWLETQSAKAFESPSSRSASRQRNIWIAGLSSAAVIAGAMIWWGESHPAHKNSPEAPPALATPAPVAPARTMEPAPAASVATTMPDAAGTAAASTPALAAGSNAPETATPATEAQPAVQSAATPPVVGTTASTNTPAATGAAKLNARDARRPADTKRTQQAAAAAKPAAPAGNGVVTLAVSPWAQVEVDGQASGTAPPLNQLTLAEGKHTITLRNDAFPPHTMTISVAAGQTVSIKHHFGP